MKLKSLLQPSVSTRLSSQLLRDQIHHREMLMKELSSVRYLARQGLALRGHKEEDGNLMQLLKCRAEDIQGLGLWIHEGRSELHAGRAGPLNCGLARGQPAVAGRVLLSARGLCGPTARNRPAVGPHNTY